MNYECSFSSRSVIVPGPELRIDQVILPYQAMTELLQQDIINILHKSYNMSNSQAYNVWSASQRQYDQRIMDIMKAIIADRPRGLEVLINRKLRLHIVIYECITF